MLKTFPKAGEHLKSKLLIVSIFGTFVRYTNISLLPVAIVSFGQFTPEQREQFSKFGLAIHSWDEFLSLVSFFVFFVFSSVYMRLFLIIIIVCMSYWVEG